ncbi:MAG: rhombotarget lipoprotein [Cellvibrionaceae bacterium]
MKDIRLLIAIVLFLFISGCSNIQSQRKSSLIDYLYSSNESQPTENIVTTLTLPIKVGVAFVPETNSYNKSQNSLTEKNKFELMKLIADRFTSYDFVDSVHIIPSSYLTQNGGFDDLDKLQKIQGIDVIALISFDQIQFTDEGFLSLSYLTLIGAYIIAGEKNDTNTMLDTAVYDINSRKLLFRAPGTDQIKNNSTPISLRKSLRQDSHKSFELATRKMIENLEAELERFRERAKNDPKQFEISKGNANPNKK